MSEAWSIIASSLRFPVCDGHTASACLVSFWFFFLLLFFYLPFVCWGSVIIYRQGEGEGGRKAEGSSEDFCVTITFTLRLCNFLLTPLPPAPPPQSLAFNWQSISDIPLLYYVNDHPPPPENNVISPLKSSKPLPTPTGDKQGLTGTSCLKRYILGGREWLHNKNESVRIKLFQVTKCWCAKKNGS